MNTDTQTPQVPYPLLEMRIRQLQMLLSETTQQFNSRIFNNTPKNLTIEQVAEISILAEALFVKVSEYSASMPQVPSVISSFITSPSQSPQQSIPAHPGGVMPASYPETKPEPTGMCIERFM